MPLPLILWGLDPLFSTARKMLVFSLRQEVQVVTRPMEGRYEFYLYDRPLQRVEVVGVIVKKTVKTKKVMIEIDDGTGVLECTKLYNSAENEPVPLQGFSLGQLVCIRGQVAMAGDPSQLVLLISHSARQLDPNEQSLHWIRAMHLMRTVYSLPYVIPLDRNDNKAKLGILSMGCCCGTPHEIKETLLFCRCIGSHVFPSAGPEALVALKVLGFLVNTFEAPLHEDEVLYVSVEDTANDRSCQRQVAACLSTYQENKASEADSMPTNA